MALIISGAILLSILVLGLLSLQPPEPLYQTAKPPQGEYGGRYFDGPLGGCSFGYYLNPAYSRVPVSELSIKDWFEPCLPVPGTGPHTKVMHQEPDSASDHWHWVEGRARLPEVSDDNALLTVTGARAHSPGLSHGGS